MTMKQLEKYDKMVALEIATEDELELVFKVTGCSWDEVIDMVCEARTGYETFDKFYAAEVQS